MPHFARVFILLMIVSISVGDAAAAPSWVSNLPLWRWYSIPNTALSTVAASPTPLGSTGPSSKIVAWNGATLKRAGSIYMLGAAGGHGDYAGNEVNAITLNTESPAWTQLRGPSSNSNVINSPAQFFLDLRPSPTHTYYATQFIESRNRMFVLASPGLSGSFPAAPANWPYNNAPRSFSFNLSTNDWDHPDYVGLYTGGGDFTAAMTVKHQITEDIYMARSGAGWWKWTQATNTWAKLNNNGEINYAGAAIDPTRNRMLIVGDYSGTANPRVRDLDGNIVPVTFAGLGSSVLKMGGYPGVVYDEANDVFLVIYNSSSGIGIYRVNASTWTIDVPSITGTSPMSRQNGIQNSVQYVPELGGIVIANSYTGNVQFMRTSSAGSATPPPPSASDTTAPSIPTMTAATALSSSEINLSWNASTDNVAVAGYRVYRGGVQIASVSSTTSYQDSKLSPATQYSYTISAYDAAGNLSGQTAAASATTLGITAPPTSAGTPILLVKFGKTSTLSAFGLSGWSTVIKDVYTDYQDIGPGGTTIVVGDNYTYNYQGVSGSTRNFISGEKISVNWYNNSGTTLTFTPNISFNDPDRIAMGATGAWYPMTSVTVPSTGSAMSEYTFNPATAGSYSLVNINVNYINTRTIVADKIELFPIGSATSSFEFALSNDGNKTVAQGQTVSNSITANLVSGMAQLVSLSITGLPSGAAVTTAQNSCTPTCSTSMNIATSGSTATGTYPITISASSGSVIRTSNFNLTITTGTSTAPPSPSPTPAPSGGVITSFLVTSPVSQQAAPFTLGQPFRQGDVPSGSSVVASIPDFQSSVKTRWPDGSVQFAILSGRTNLQANMPLRIDLSAGPAPTGPALTEQELLSQGGNMQVSFSGIGTVELSSLIGTNGSYNTSFNRWNPGKVLDWIIGPEMSSWIYSSPIGSDNSLSAWFEVRLWKEGHIEILPWIENGYLNKIGVTEKNGTATVTVSGSQRFSNLLRVLHHTRTLLVAGTTYSYWLGTDPQVKFKHDTAYIQQSKLVPTYGATTPSSSSALASLALSYTPFGQANYPAVIGSAGYHPSIGLLPQWDVLYLTTAGDSRALAAVSVNAYSAGRYSIHYRDEKTNRPLKISSYPNLVINDPSVPSTGSSSLNTYTPASGGGSPPAWATSHAPSVGYMAYLLYGRFYFMEESQFAATLVFLKQTDTTRQFSKGILETAAGANTTRGAGWGLRTYAQAAIATPDNDPLKPEFTGAVDQNIIYYHSRYIGRANNAQGIAQPYSDYTPGDGIYMHAMWMEDFLTAAMGYIVDAKANTVAVISQATSLFTWKAHSAIGRLGQAGVSTEYDFRDAAQYNMAVAPTDNANWATGAGPWYANWGDLYRATMGTNAGTAPANQLRGGNFPESTSYWGNFQPAIAYAVTNNVPGASAAYARMTGASNWSQFFAGFSNAPEWSVVPSNSSVSTPPADISPRTAPADLSLR